MTLRFSLFKNAIFGLIAYLLCSVAFANTLPVEEGQAKHATAKVATEKKASSDLALVEKYAKKVYALECLADALRGCLLIGSIVAWLRGDISRYPSISSKITIVTFKCLASLVTQLVCFALALLLPLCMRILISKCIAVPPTQVCTLHYKKRIFKKRWLIDGGIVSFLIATIPVVGVILLATSDKELETIHWSTLYLCVAIHISFILSFFMRHRLYMKTPFVLKRKEEKAQSSMAIAQLSNSTLQEIAKYAQKVFFTECIVDAISFCLLIVNIFLLGRKLKGKFSDLKDFVLEVNDNFFSQVSLGALTLLLTPILRLGLSKLIAVPPSEPLTLVYKKKIFKTRWLIDLLTPIFLLNSVVILAIVTWLRGESLLSDGIAYNSSHNIIPFDYCIIALTLMPYLSFLISFCTRLILYLKEPFVEQAPAHKVKTRL